MKFFKDPSGLKIWFEKIGEKTWIHSQGHTFVFKEKSKKVPLQKKQKIIFSSSFKAPFPGRILSIKVRQKDTVQPHQHLIVIESMKIEHTLSIPHPAQVKNICVQEGESVELNQELIQLTEL